MSAISELTDRLRLFAIRTEMTYPFLSRSMKQAADTIEELSAKLTTANMELSSAWYGGGWIPCEERFPEEDVVVLVSTRAKNGSVNVDKGYMYNGRWAHRGRALVTAWMPLPEPYKED